MCKNLISTLILSCESIWSVHYLYIKTLLAPQILIHGNENNSDEEVVTLTRRKTHCLSHSLAKRRKEIVYIFELLVE